MSWQTTLYSLASRVPSSPGDEILHLVGYGKADLRGGQSVTPRDAQEAQTLWVDLLAFGALADALGALAKGDMVSAIGRLTRGTYTTRDGETREQYTVIADALISA